MEAVLLLRVSTVGQEPEQQKKDLINYANSLGYNTLHYISDKESGVKLSEEERNGLIELKELCRINNNIKGVFVYSLSRLGRNQVVLHSMKEWFIRHQINLYIYDKKYYLLEKDGTTNQSTELLFSIYGYFTEDDAKTTKLITMRGKEYWRKKGKFCGGTMVYGYTTDKEGYIIPNEDELNIVKYLFDKYINTDITIRHLAKESMERGLIKQKNIRSGASWLKCILTNYAYCGEQSIFSPKAPLIYPPTLPKEWIDKARTKLESAKKLPRTTTNVYWCKGLIKDKRTNLNYIATVTDAAYRTQYGYVKYNQININLIDSIAWHFTRFIIYPIILSEKDSEQDKNIKEQIRINEDKLTVINKKYLNIEKQLNNMKKLYIIGDLTDDEYSNLKKEHLKNKAILSDSKKRLEESNVNLRQLLENALKRTGITLNDIWNITDEMDIKNIINESIDRIVIERVDDNHNITIISKLGMEFDIVYNKKSNEIIYKGKPIKNFKLFERFKNKRKKG